MEKIKPIQFLEKAQDTIAYLYSRWQDEKDYEDIKDYSIPLEKIAISYNIKIIKMNKKPFGFDFEYNNKIYRIKINSRKIDLVIIKE